MSASVKGKRSGAGGHPRGCKMREETRGPGPCVSAAADHDPGCRPLIAGLT